jgi:hypothetical protein
MSKEGTFGAEWSKKKRGGRDGVVIGRRGERQTNVVWKEGGDLFYLLVSGIS